MLMNIKGANNMDIFLKYFGIIGCSIFCTSKINKNFFIKKVSFLFYLITLSTIMIFLENSSFFMFVPIIIIFLQIAYCRYISGIILVEENIFSLTIGYVSFLLSTIFNSFLLYPFSDFVWVKYGGYFILVMQWLLILIMFNKKRIRNGMVVLQKQIYSMFGGVINICVILFSVLLNKKSNEKYLVYILLCLICLSVVVLIYWRTSITRHYLERLSLRNIDMLNKELEEKNAYIEKLLEDKNRIEKLNHKNYKLVPAMQGAVMHYLNGVKSYMESTLVDPALAEMAVTSEGTFVKNKLSNFIEEGNKLIEELNKMNSEWTEYVNNDNLNGDSDVPSCGVPRVDYILSYMHERSLKEDFILKINVEQSLEKLTEKIISEEDLATLLADLIDNSIIATKYNNGKQILVRLGMMGKDYTVEVYDSGVPFDKEVLVKYGREQITTHADDSGSGIGMMQTFEILSKCGAGLFVDEYKQGEGVYTKRISVVFNRKHQYVLYTCRNDEDIAYLKKRSDLMVIKK